MKKYLMLILTLPLILLSFGCAKTVTQIVDYGTQMTAEIEFRGNIDLIQNRYFIVFSSQSDFKTPQPPPDSKDEFLSIGDLPQDGNISDYYNNYFSDWDGYIEINNLGITAYRGPFIINISPPKEVLSDVVNISNKISFSIRLDQIFGSTIPDTLYFNIVSVDYPLDSFKLTKDQIYPPTQSIKKISGEQLSGNDPEDPTLNQSLDILSWKVIIQ